MSALYSPEHSGEALTRYIAVFLGCPSVSVIPQVFLKSSFGICRTMPELAYSNASVSCVCNIDIITKSHLRLIDIVLPSFTHKPEPRHIPAFREQKD